LAAGYLHVLVLTHAGALWRDEVGTVNLATLPHFADTWKMLAHNADPILFPSVVRLWSALGLGRTDLGLRMLGLVTGLSVVAAIWFSGRLMRISWPVLSLALLATNLALVRWGDSLRPYGVGCALLLLLVGSVWSFVSRPSRKRFLIACVVGVLGVQSVYQTCFFLLATCCSGAVVCLRRNQRKEALATLGIGLPAALSVIPYIPLIVEAQSWLALQKRSFHPLFIWFRFFDALNLCVNWMYLVWLALLLIAVGVGLATLVRGGRTNSADPRDLPIFASSNLVMGTIGLLVFHWIAKFDVYPWHWLPFMVFAAVNIEAALTDWAQRFRTSWLILACIVSLAPLPAAAAGAKCAHTNMDIVAAQVSKLSEAGDFIVVYPWSIGISFARYYTGPVEWTTLPPVNDSRFHRYDLVKQDLLDGEPIKPLFDRVERALASGHHVWLVGGLPQPNPGETEVPSFPPPPAPNSQTVWFDADYSYIWGRQMADFTLKHATYSWVPEISLEHCLIGYEQVPVFMVTGWTNIPSQVSGSSAQ
jgi:hypothetical protein